MTADITNCSIRPKPVPDASAVGELVFRFGSMAAQ